MPINSRRKGHEFERQVVKLLNEAFNITEDKDKWRRVPLSGGFDKKNFPGDVYTVSKELNELGAFASTFSIECKFHKEWKLEDLINGNSPDLLKWWIQAKTDGAQASKYPFLVFKKNNSKVYCMTQVQEFHRFFRDQEELFPYLAWRNENYGTMVISPFEPTLKQAVKWNQRMAKIREHSRSVHNG